MNTLIQELNGFKLYKVFNTNYFEVETPEGFKQVYKHPTFSFEETISRGWIWVEVEYFTATIKNSEIKINKAKKQIKSNSYNMFLKSHFIDAEKLKNKLKLTLKKANVKFDRCFEAFEKLKKEMDFDLDYQMYGDTFGIYEDFQYISFKIDNVYCEYQLFN